MKKERILAALEKGVKWTGRALVLLCVASVSVNGVVALYMYATTGEYYSRSFSSAEIWGLMFLGAAAGALTVREVYRYNFTCSLREDYMAQGQTLTKAQAKRVLGRYLGRI